MEKLVRVIVASKAKLKLAAVKNAFTPVFKSLDVTGESCPSLINEQPYGHEETLLGARNRLKAALAATMLHHPRADYVVSMENGIVDMPARENEVVDSFDLAWVIVHRLRDGAEAAVPSAGVQFPASAVQAAKELNGGFAKHTVGSVIAAKAAESATEESGAPEEQGAPAAKKAKTCDPQDPHSWLTGGAMGREEVLAAALRIALASLPAIRVGPGEGTDAEVRGLLSAARRIAVVGASNREEAPVYHVMQFLISQGYTVIPINPREAAAGGEILGQKVVGSVAEVTPKVDIVDIFLRSDRVGEAVEAAVAAGAGAVWVQKEIAVEPETVAKARGAGLAVVTNRCPRIEIPRLSITTPLSQ